MATRKYYKDVLIIGGGAAGCFAAITLGKKSDLDVILVDKSNIKRSGCLAAGINAINAYLNDNQTPDDYVKYVSSEFDGIVREDLLKTIGERLNKVTEEIEEFGLKILKDEDGKYVGRGKRSIKINGENIKPILSNKVKEYKNVQVLNKVNIIDYILKDNKVIGAIGIDVKNGDVVVIYAKATICTTGGASGVYKPNNPGFSKHKMWYSPFNTGAGYGMGIRAGAEMTSFEIRFIALRVKDTIAPTGTIAQGVRTPQVNSLGEKYMDNYSLKTTAMRLYGTIEENRNGTGPCYLKTEGISKEQETELKKAYLNMAPAQVLKWFDNETDIKEENIEISGTEPYLVGGHSSSGYWIDNDRRTTLSGLYAGGDVAGGSPKKYVTGAFSEGEIAAETIINDIKDFSVSELSLTQEEELINTLLQPLFRVKRYDYSVKKIEEYMQKTMDEYAGGISSNYGYNEEKLKIALKEIKSVLKILEDIQVSDTNELIEFYEVRDRLYISLVLINHLLERKETRWRIYGENLTHKDKDDNYKLFINSITKGQEVSVVKRKLKEAGYEYFNN